MCGFAGVVTWDDRYRVSPETLRKMSATIAHRGPDGEGYYINHEHEVSSYHPQVALAFRRLAILDPDPRSNQPFTDGRHWLVFNGEIYNFHELRQELTQLRPEYLWRTSGDTEVLLCAYAVWGKHCLRHLNGMFAFAIWDPIEKALFLARDRMGQKPLFLLWADENYAIAFASEIDALKSSPLWTGRVDNLDGFETFLRYGNTGFRHIHRGLNSCGPGEYCRILRPYGLAGGGYEEDNPYSYWHLRPGPSDNDSTAVKLTREKVETAVQRQLVSDVPLGVFLSGGIDSSVIAACARRSGPIQTFSLGFDDPRYDETEYARRVAQHLGTNHHELHVSPRVIEDLQGLARVFGEPFADSSMLPTHYLSRETRKHVNVALSGDGGDELFGGYERYRAMRIASRSLRWKGAQGFLAGISTTSTKLLAGGHPKSLSARLSRFLYSLSFNDARRYDSFLRIFDDKAIEMLLGRRPSTEAEVEQRYERDKRSVPDSVRRALACDRDWYLPNDLLTKVDRCSMLHGLEVRSPFMDHELVQFAAGLTTDQLLKGGPKRMLREAFKDDLPAWVFKRKKMGFAVPIGDWFRGQLRPMLRDTLFATDSFSRQHFNMKVIQRLIEEHEQSRIDHSQRLYALLMLELWWNTVKHP